MNTKHIEVRYHQIQELVTSKKLEVQKVNTEVIIVDSLTKWLPDHRFRGLRRQMGLQQAEEHDGAESKEETEESKTAKFDEPKRPSKSKLTKSRKTTLPLSIRQSANQLIV